MPDNSRAINRVFTSGVITDLLERGSSEVFDIVVRRYIDDPESKTHGQIISEIYTRLDTEYRNEYYYMNTLLNKLLVGIHSVNTATALSQVRIGRHIADLVMINGEGIVYEIKSGLDNFNRLHDQLSDYYRAFSKVSVLTDINERERIECILDSFRNIGKSVGIYVLSERDTIFSKTSGRMPKEFDSYLEHSCIFKLLRKHEYENIIQNAFGELPQVAPAFYFRACLERFQQIPIKIAQTLTFCELKKRNKITKTIFERIQPELKSTVYFSRLAQKLSKLEQLLQTNYKKG
jgi:hypothetical protein